MRLLSFLSILLCIGLIFNSCQKEFLPGSGTTAKGKLQKDSIGDCMPILVNGAYKKDTLLNATNYADVSIVLTQAGTYSIKSDTVNGYSFSGTGTASNIGINTVRLFGIGRPFTGGLNSFKIKLDSSSCEFDVFVTGSGGGGGTAAAYTLAGSPSSCTGAAQTANFYAGIPTTPANTVTVNANVTQAGTYTITATTTPANGLTFTGTGNLAVGNNQPITLVANGTPTTGGSIPYTLATTAPASNCGFNLTVQAAPTPATFTFNCASPAYTGTYQAHVPTTGNTATISVTSVAGGSYNITSSGTVNNNNVMFMGSGVLSASPNPQNITLYASGIPDTAGTFAYTITGGAGSTGTCTISQTYAAAPVGFITCNIDGVAKTFNENAYAQFDNSAGIPTLGIFGQETASMYPQLNLGIVDDGGITVFNYDANQAAAGNLVNISYNLTSTNVFTGGTDIFNQSNLAPVKIYITSITTGPTARIKGTFLGPIKNGGTVKMVTNGNFDVPIQ